MPKTVRPPRPVPAGDRHFHGLSPDEFTAYPDTDGRAEPETCTHPIFLDHDYPVTGLCLECGHEIVLGQWKLATPDTPIFVHGMKIVPEGVLLTDAELDTHRTRWHAIWGLDGWTHPKPDLAHAAPPLRLRGKVNAVPDARVVRSTASEVRVVKGIIKPPPPPKR